MELLNIIGGFCSIVGLLVSLFTAGKVIKINQTIHSGNKDDHSKTINSNKKSTFDGSYAGRDSTNDRNGE